MNTKTKKTPNFFVVGAPKCGTTSMYEYLRQHPDIFMPHDEENFWKAKEPHYFASDLGIKDRVRIENENEYMGLFQQANGQSRIGESSALYLYSPAAAGQIYQLAIDKKNDTKIVIMLRPPIEMIQSWHRDCLRWGHEDIASFREAVEAESDRKAGKRIPEFSEYPSRLIYTEMGHYLRHVTRYIELFGRDSVHIALLEDLENEPEKTYIALLEFLDIDPTFMPEFGIHNKAIDLDASHVGLQRLKMFLLNRLRFTSVLFKKLSPQQQEFVRSMPKRILPRKPKKPIDPGFINELNARYTSEIQQLGKLINRDLAHWCN